MTTSLGIDLKSPLEAVIEIITEMRDSLDSRKQIANLNYALKMISSGKLYEHNIDIEDNQGDLKREMSVWLG